MIGWTDGAPPPEGQGQVALAGHHLGLRAADIRLFKTRPIKPKSKSTTITDAPIKIHPWYTSQNAGRENDFSAVRFRSAPHSVRAVSTS